MFPRRITMFMFRKSSISFMSNHIYQSIIKKNSITPTFTEYVYMYIKSNTGMNIQQGRWDITHIDKKHYIDKKIDLANEDHCGVCDK
jgi:hypothetical protein